MWIVKKVCRGRISAIVSTSLRGCLLVAGNVADVTIYPSLVPYRCPGAALPLASPSLAAAFPVPCRCLAGGFPVPCRCLPRPLPVPCRCLAGALPVPYRCLAAALPLPCRCLASVTRRNPWQIVGYCFCLVVFVCCFVGRRHCCRLMETFLGLFQAICPLSFAYYLHMANNGAGRLTTHKFLHF